MDRVFAWDHHHSQIVYRIPGHQYEDGREDSALSLPYGCPRRNQIYPRG